MEYFNEDKLKRLMVAYEKAVHNNKNSFWFDGCEYLTSYAKYVIEYLKTKFKK